MNTNLHDSMRGLRKDFGAVARDTEDLVRATADIANDRIQEIRTHAQQSLQQVRESLNGAEISRRARVAAQNADTYVGEHKWGFIGAAAGAGLLLGLFARRH